jgi:hypothetical protein
VLQPTEYIDANYRKVVTQGSASLDPENPALMIMQADHNSICKFDKQFGAFITISRGLRDVYGEVIGRSTKQPVIEHRVGIPPNEKDENCKGKGKETE